MPIFFLIVGIMLVVVGINDKISDLTTLLKADFTSDGSTPSFQVWALAIVMAGAVGYSKDLRPVSNAFLVLIIIVLLLSHKGFVAQFTKALEGK